MSDMNMKTKTQSAWITHVKKFAQENGLKYNEALKDPKLKIGYVKVERVKKSKEPMEMEMKVEPQMKVKKERKKKDMVVVMVEETPMPVVVEELVVAPKKVRVKNAKKKEVVMM
jgi:hypothetical protein